MSAVPKVLPPSPVQHPGNAGDVLQEEATAPDTGAPGMKSGAPWETGERLDANNRMGARADWPGLIRPEEIAQAETVWCSVGTLAEELGEASVAELVDDFAAQTPQLLSKLDPMCGVLEHQLALRRAAHSLKGSSSIFGLAGIERAAFQLERTVLEHELRTQAGLVLELKRQFARTVPVLKAVRKRLLGEGD